MWRAYPSDLDITENNECNISGVKCDERTDRRTDRRTDGQTGQILMLLDYRHGGIKITAVSFTFIHKIPFDQKFDTNPGDFSLNFDLKYVKSTTCDGQS